MKFCRQCGCQLFDEDRFCASCGTPCEPVPGAACAAPEAAPSNMPQNAPLLPGLPQAAPDEAILVIYCNASNPKGSVELFTGGRRDANLKVRAGEQIPIKMPLGNVVITYLVDRGPGITVVAARRTKYNKSLFFHPGETILMQVNVGRQMTHTNCQSNQGYMIP